jgi:uncharacterized protein YjbJ (UPF0337 family)
MAFGGRPVLRAYLRRFRERRRLTKEANMGFMDKIKNRLQMARGSAKQGAGRATDDPGLAAEGRGDRAGGAAKQTGEQAKDAGKNIKDAFKK